LTHINNLAQILTAFFAQASVAGFDGIAVIPGGWIDHHWVQLGYQLADSTAGFSYSFVMTTLILWVMHYIPGLSMRTNEDAEIVGIDDHQMGEFAYDYVGLEQDLGVMDIEGGLERERENALSGGREPHHTHAHNHAGESGSLEKAEPATVSA
jgi:Amt family ammonium transporter